MGKERCVLRTAPLVAGRRRDGPLLMCGRRSIGKARYKDAAAAGSGTTPPRLLEETRDRPLVGGRLWNTRRPLMPNDVNGRFGLGGDRALGERSRESGIVAPSGTSVRVMCTGTGVRGLVDSRGRMTTTRFTRLVPPGEMVPVETGSVADIGRCGESARGRSSTTAWTCVSNADGDPRRGGGDMRLGGNGSRGATRCSTPPTNTVRCISGSSLPSPIET
jgi:hypothetical protein